MDETLWGGMKVGFFYATTMQMLYFKKDESLSGTIKYNGIMWLFYFVVVTLLWYFLSPVLDPILDGIFSWFGWD